MEAPCTPHGGKATHLDARQVRDVQKLAFKKAFSRLFLNIIFRSREFLPYGLSGIESRKPSHLRLQPGRMGNNFLYSETLYILCIEADKPGVF